MAKVSGINFIKEDEVKTMPMAPMEVTKALIVNKDTGVKRDAYSAQVKFDYYSSFKFPSGITSDDYALIHYHSKRKKHDDQFVVQAHVRIVETKWPEREGRKARSTYMIQIYLNNNLKWEFDITSTQFLNAFLQGLSEGDIEKVYSPVERIPFSSEEKEEPKAAEDLQGLPPEEANASEGEDPNKLPF